MLDSQDTEHHMFMYYIYIYMYSADDEWEEQ